MGANRMECKRGTGPLIKVGLAQYRIGRAPLRMMTLALGSCLGIVLYDGETGIGAMAHVMHPKRSKVKNNSNRAKFVDAAIGVMIERLIKRGALRNKLQAKIFGGAHMFQHVVGCPGVIQIGDENIASAREELRTRGIPLVAEDVGGEKGRTLLFDVSDGSVLVQDAYGSKEIF